VALEAELSRAQVEIATFMAHYVEPVPAEPVQPAQQ
jgi:hypothetical protein